MTRTSESSPPPRWGLLATCLLGIGAVLATVLAAAVRVGEPPTDPTGADPADAMILAEPDHTVTVDRSRAVRVDTIPQVLSAGHAVEIEGGWVVLDPVGRRVHLVSDVGSDPPRSFGGEGEGPGEFRQPQHLAVSGSTIAVLEAAGNRLVRYGLDGTVAGPVGLAQESCPFGPAAGLATAADGGFVVLRTCTTMDGGTRALLLGVDPAGGVRVVEDRPLQSLRTGPVDPYAAPALVGVLGTPHLGTFSSGCLRRVVPVPGGVGPAALCLPSGSGPPLPDTVRADLEALDEKMREIGGSVAIPERLPPFTGVRSTEAGPVLEVPLANGRTALDLVLQGGRRVRYTVEIPRTTFVGRRHLLLARPLLEGTELAWVERDG